MAWVRPDSWWRSKPCPSRVPERRDHRPRHHVAVAAGFDVGRIADRIRERRVVQPPLPQRGDLAVEPATYA